MPYATKSEMLQRYGETELQQLTDREMPITGSIVDSVLDRAMGDADSVVNRHLASRYAVPLTGTLPADIARTACEIARYFLYDAAAPEQVRKHYEDALRWLRDVGEGRLPLVTADGAVVSPRATGGFSTSGRAPYPATATFGDAFAAAWRP
jgi:phage gp36-like protein